MLFQKIIMFILGYVNISVEGFFIEKFINACKSKDIVLQNLHLENDSFLKAKVLKSDFKDIVHISKKTKCKIKIERKNGIPFFVNKYRRRKIFAIAICVIAILIFVLTRFIWNIDIEGNENIEEAEIIDMINKYGINIGTRKNSINTQKVCNLIMIEREDIAWIGINIKGTNAIVSIKESKRIPEIIDRNEICNIVANKSAQIDKIIVRNGTAKVNVGDYVNQGDLLVEGMMEGTYTGTRLVHADADVYGENTIIKEKKESFVQNETIFSGKKEKIYEMCINNFKINFNKRVSKFKNYDTINKNMKLRFFSNYYFPIEMKIITNEEIEMLEKKYSEEELKTKIVKEIEDEFEKEYSISEIEEENINRNEEITNSDDELNVKITYIIREQIGTKVNVN